MTNQNAFIQGKINGTKTFVLIFLYIGIVTGIIYAIGYYYGNTTIAAFGLIFAVGQSMVAYFWGHKMALAAAGSKEISYDQAPELHDMVAKLAKTAGVPKPRVYISPDKSPNAFACGNSPKNAHISFNQGIMDLLTKDELEGVAAHEMAHVQNRDILIMTVTMVLSSVLGFLANIGSMGMTNNSNQENRGGLAIFGIFLMILAPFVSMLIQMAVSRSREYVADADGALFTGNPMGLANALRKLENSPIPTEHPNATTNHFYIVEPKINFGEKIGGLFSTHPPLQSRIAALEAMVK